MQLISPNEKTEILQQLLDSPEFKDSKRYGELLQFLMEKSIKGENLKETTIAHEFFGKEISFDPGKESFVRAYISGLRKRIEHYYLTSTDVKKYIVSIPKGQYNVQFEVVHETPQSAAKQGKNKKILLFSGVGILVVVVAAIIFLLPVIKSTTAPGAIAKDPLLSGFVGTPSKKTIIALGDFFFFTDNKPLPDERTYLRNSRINNERDLNEWLKSNPENAGKYQALNYTYLRPSSCIGIMSVLRRFRYEADNFEIKMASTLKWQDFEKSNIIFIGSLKTLYILDTLLQKTNFRYSANTKDINIIDKNGNTTQAFHVNPVRSGRYMEDFGIVLKIPSSNNNNILVLTGFSGVGIMGAVKMAIDDNLCDNVNKNFKVTIQDAQQHFIVISKTSGVEETVFDYKMQYFKMLNTF